MYDDGSPYSGKVRDWDADKVARWVGYIGLGMYSSHFTDHNVGGDVLLYLDLSDLKEMGIQSVGHRLRILKAVYELGGRQTSNEDEGEEYDRPRYIPATVRAGKEEPTVHSFAIRDERISYTEGELLRLLESHARLREDLLPIFRAAKESKPLPTPEGNAGGSQGIPTTSGLSPTIASAVPSPTHFGPQMNLKRVRSKKSINSVYAGNNIRSPTDWEESMRKRAGAAPPAPPPSSTSSSIGLSGLSSTGPASTPGASSTGSSGGGGGSTTSPLEPFKSFRVTMEDPCYKVLPAALRKYKITGDWRQYALLVCYGDQERQLGMDEKPLMIFKELQDAGERPVFMLRHMESGTPGSAGHQGVVVGGTPGGVL
uniref:ARAD1D28622p n=1 Tax=Blastobotrys adeninivorans TaxID=409370 RepID=A0A060TAS9_BLAAD